MKNEPSADYCYFIFDIKSYTLAIQDQRQIGIKVILNKLRQFLPSEHRDSVLFDQQKDKFNVYRRIHTWDRFVMANFVLKPTNPSSDPEFEVLDDLIDKTNASKARLKFEATDKEGSLTTENNSLVEQGIAMASAGYGEFNLHGVRGGEVDKISSKTKHLKKSFIVDAEGIVKKVVDYIVKFKEGHNES